jgi:hypothetical protein
MERGAERFFTAIPSWDQAGGKPENRLTATAGLLAQHPDFLRLFYLLSLERNDDPAVAEVVRRVRDTAITGFREMISHLVPDGTPPAKAKRAIAELTAFAVAHSDGVFFAGHLEPDVTDVPRMYRRLWQAVTAMMPILLEEK